MYKHVVCVCYMENGDESWYAQVVVPSVLTNHIGDPRPSQQHPTTMCFCYVVISRVDEAHFMLVKLFI